MSATQEKKISFFGAGLMGYPLIEALVDAGYPLALWNRTLEKLKPLVEKSNGRAHAHESPATCIEFGDVVIAMTFDYKSVVDTILPHVALLKGKTFIHMNTVSPDESVLLQKQVEQAGGTFVESPVLGTNTVAQARKLNIMVSGPEAAFESVKDILSHFGTPKFHGPIPNALKMKLVLNQMVLSQTVMFANSLTMVEKQGLDPERFMELLRGGAFHSRYFDLKYPLMHQRSYTPVNFDIQGARKDIDLITAEAEKLGMDTRYLHGVQDIVRKAAEQAKSTNSTVDMATVFEAFQTNQ